MICTACGMTGHRASTCPLELWRRVDDELQQFWADFDDGSLFDVGPEVLAAAERVAALYPDAFKCLP